MNRSIPFFSLKRQHSKYKAQIEAAVASVLETQQFIGGQFVENFEKKIAKYTTAKHAISCNSGTDALWLSLKALGLKKDEIVLTTPFSFIASSSEIVAHGGHPVFIDIDETNYNIDPLKLEAWIEKNCTLSEDTGKLVHNDTGYRVAGIITVDIFGQSADYEKIDRIKEMYNLWVVQDSCQAIGTIDKNGKHVGTHGDISCFSFYPTKNLGAYGDGGCCTTNNLELAGQLLQLRNHGRKSHYNYVQHGVNSRLDGIQAAILTEKLKLIDGLNDRRIEIAKIYDKSFEDIEMIQTPKAENGRHTYHQYCLKLNYGCRDSIIKELADSGVACNIYYPKSLDEIEFLNTDVRLKNNCPIARDLTKTIFALPIWPELENSEIEYVCEKVKNVLNNRSLNERIKNESKGLSCNS